MTICISVFPVSYLVALLGDHDMSYPLYLDNNGFNP